MKYLVLLILLVSNPVNAIEPGTITMGGSSSFTSLESVKEDVFKFNLASKIGFFISKKTEIYSTIELSLGTELYGFSAALGVRYITFHDLRILPYICTAIGGLVIDSGSNSFFTTLLGLGLLIPITDNVYTNLGLSALLGVGESKFIAIPVTLLGFEVFL